MATRVRSFSKINLGLAVGPTRGDGFHGLTTVYQTLGLHDFVTVSAQRAEATKITLTADHRGVPRTETGDAEKNTAFVMVSQALLRMGIRAEVSIGIEKRLPVQGGMGAGSANAVAALLGLERELGVALPGAERLRLAAEVGSDVPLFLLGGTVLGLGRGEEVYPLPDLPGTWCVVAVPEVGVSTKLAFAELDKRAVPQGLTVGDVGVLSGMAEVVPLQSQRSRLDGGAEPVGVRPREADGVGGSGPGLRSEGRATQIVGLSGGALTFAQGGDRLGELSRALAAVWTTSGAEHVSSGISGEVSGSGVSLRTDLTAGGLAENPLLALVRTGIENDFEEVAFSQHPSLRQIKRELLGSETGHEAVYACLSGSGSALFGLYASQTDARAAQYRVQQAGTKAILTETLTRPEYWHTMFAE